MKVLHLNTYPSIGGASVAVRLLDESLKKKGIHSQILFLKNRGISKILNKCVNIFDALPKLFYPRRSSEIFSLSWIAQNQIKKIKEINPDIVHLHWINKGLLSIQEIQKIDKPIVWTFHDCWPFTGGCHTIGDCQKFVESCGGCPILSSQFTKDISYKTLRIKEKSFDRAIQVVVPSQWMKDNVQKSRVFRNHAVSIIPNGVNLNIFFPKDRLSSRKKFNISETKKVILFGAVILKDKNKGFHLLKEVLKQLENPESYEFVTFGKDQEVISELNFIQVKSLGFIHDPALLSEIYSLADVTVVPSIQESFGLTALESMACGTPVVAFEGSGVSQIIDHQRNGYLAEAKNASDLLKGINWVLESTERLKFLSEQGLEKVRLIFNIDKITEQYLSLYTNLK